MFSRKEYAKLNAMLDSAIEGSFEEKDFDESELSKLQSKLMRYLSSSFMSERKVEEEKDYLKELITNISHQTKTPLTNILMYCELLRESSLEGKEKAYVDEIYMHSKKMETLVEALVKMSRLEVGVFQFEKTETKYSDIVKKVSAQALSKAKSKNINIVTDNNEDYSVCVDEKWIVEAIFNIVDNAIKYSEAGTNIYMEVFSYEFFSGLRIRDEGIGISEEEIPMLFGRFYRGKGVRDKEGIGVGLFLAREIVEGNGGYIKVKSEPGKGSCFEVCFPNMSTV